MKPPPLGFYAAWPYVAQPGRASAMSVYPDFMDALREYSETVDPGAHAVLKAIIEENPESLLEALRGFIGDSYKLHTLREILK